MMAIDRPGGRAASKLPGPDPALLPAEVVPRAAPYMPGSRRHNTTRADPQACADGWASYRKRRSNPSRVRRCDSWASCPESSRPRAKNSLGFTAGMLPGTLSTQTANRSRVRTRAFPSSVWWWPFLPGRCGTWPKLPTRDSGGWFYPCALRFGSSRRAQSRSFCARSQDLGCAPQSWRRSPPTDRRRRSSWNGPRLSA